MLPSRRTIRRVTPRLPLSTPCDSDVTARIAFSVFMATMAVWLFVRHVDLYVEVPKYLQLQNTGNSQVTNTILLNIRNSFDNHMLYVGIKYDV